MRETMSELSPELLLAAYAHGVFPMAESRDDPDLYWLDPDERGILPLEAFHLSRRLRRTVRADRFDVRVDSAFPLTKITPIKKGLEIEREIKVEIEGIRRPGAVVVSVIQLHF